jgi:hypothetical protein
MFIKSDIINSTRKTINIIFAMSNACAALLVKPNTPSAVAMRRKNKTQCNIILFTIDAREDFLFSSRK